MKSDSKHVVNHCLDKDYYDTYLELAQDISYTRIGRYALEQKIGYGAFGKVYKGFQEDNQLQVAAKTIDIHKIHQKTNLKLKQIELRLVKSEDVIMRICDSPNLMKCYDVYENADFKIMILEYCNGGTLKDYIEHRGKIAQDEAIAILRQILNGIKELHSNSIVHRDLKSQNILIHNQLFKIADFGFSKKLQLQPGLQVQIGTHLGTITNMAPEIMKRQKYGLKADIWSIGIILFQMVFGQFPFLSTQKMALMQEINNSHIHKRQKIIFNKYAASIQMSKLIKQMLEIDQTKRIGWKQLIQHKIFIKNIDNLPRSIIPMFPIHFPLEIDLQNIESQYQNENNSIINAIQIDIRDSTVIILRKMNRESIKLLKQKSKDMKEYDRHFIQTRKYLYDCLRNELIYNEMICKIQENKLLDIQQRKVIEFLYVITSRCYINISNIIDIIKINKDKYAYIPQILIPIENLYNKLKIKFHHFQKTLFEQQNKIFNKFHDVFRSKEQLQTIDKFLCGIFGLDYKLQEQLQFIENYYINSLKNDIKGKDNDVVMKVYDFMLHYRKINLVDFKNIKGGNFDAFIVDMMRK